MGLKGPQEVAPVLLDVSPAAAPLTPCPAAVPMLPRRAGPAFLALFLFAFSSVIVEPPRVLRSGPG